MKSKNIIYVIIFLILIIPLFLFLLAIHSFFPLIVFLILSLVYFTLQKTGTLKLKIEKLRNKVALFLIVIVISCCTNWVLYDAVIFDMGPFYPTDFNGNYDKLEPKDSITYRSGYLVTYKNKNPKVPPILVYKKNNKVIWGQQLNAPEIFWDDKNSTPNQITNEINLSKVNEGIFKDSFEFFALDYGEPGWGYIWRFGKIQKFYIMSF
jgi:energy-coupling factor transporter transmembrane protein EcfT